MIFTEKMQSQKMGFRDYIEALEEERRKIEVFQRELPLCLELVTQAIDACRQQLSGTTSEYNLNGQSECSEQTSMEGPVLEEFIPIKKRASPDCDENEDEDEHHSHNPKISKENKNTDKKKSDWLRSVQLWNPDLPVKEDIPRKAALVEVKRNGGAFQPFQREESSGKANASADKAPASSPMAAASCTAGAGAVTGGGSSGNNKREEKDGQAQRKLRRCWSPELHKRFLQALQQLGGPDSATPKQIREFMKVDGLTNDEVKSHLQKYRLHTRRPTPMMHNNANPQTAPFVLVGNIFVQPPEYAAAVATTSTAASEVTTVAAPGGIYAPVASHPPTVAHKPTPSVSKPQFKKLEHSEHSHSEERTHHSNSPASSSSTHTTTNSSGY